MVSIVTVSIAAEAQPAKQPVIVLTNVHAHNDYEHTRPLFDALDNGFGSVEADIHFVDGQLLVAHERQDVQTSRTLQSLYLDPLREIAKANGGRVYAESSHSVQLLIDFKSKSALAWPPLQKILASYSDILSEFHSDGTSVTRAVTVVLSGARPSAATLLRKDIRLAAIDGKMTELSTTIPLTLMPLVSADWKESVHWDGTGTIPETEKQTLVGIVAKVHAQGRKLRFWGAPDNLATWRELQSAGVDYLNTDDLPGMRKFLTHPDSQ